MQKFPKIKETSLTANTGTERRGCCPMTRDAKTPTGLCGRIHLRKKLHKHIGEGLRAGQV